MAPALTIFLALAAAYVVGSIDFAVVVARMYGVDITKEGSGNPGASNVLRTVGRLPAALVLVGDALKGVVGAGMGLVASGTTDFRNHWVLAAGLAAVLGHCYPVFHRFRGGKGVATGFGVLLFSIPVAALIEIMIWAIVVAVTKTAALGSLVVLILALPFAYWQGIRGAGLLWLGATLALILWRHRSNLSRLLSGSEGKVTS